MWRKLVTTTNGDYILLHRKTACFSSSFYHTARKSWRKYSKSWSCFCIDDGLLKLQTLLVPLNAMKNCLWQSNGCNRQRHASRQSLMRRWSLLVCTTVSMRSQSIASKYTTALFSPTIPLSRCCPSSYALFSFHTDCNLCSVASKLWRVARAVVRCWLFVSIEFQKMSLVYYYWFLFLVETGKFKLRL